MAAHVIEALESIDVAVEIIGASMLGNGSTDMLEVAMQELKKATDSLYGLLGVSVA